MPAPQSDLANYLLKDPYIFDVAGTRELVDENDIEKQLVEHVTRYLLEMGNGFAFVARQKHFQVGDSDFYADLILYNIKLHAYIVIELKATPFKPEYAGQLNFYINSLYAIYHFYFTESIGISNSYLFHKYKKGIYCIFSNTII